MSNPSSTNIISAALAEPFNDEEAFKLATAATVRALGIAPTHEIHFGRMWQSGPEHTEFPIIADDKTLRGLADSQAALLRFHHDYGAPEFETRSQAELFEFLEQIRCAACLVDRFAGTKENLLHLWANDAAIDFKTLEGTDPENEQLNQIVTAARHVWLNSPNPEELPPFIEIYLQQLKVSIFEPEQFLDAARQFMTMLWQQRKPVETPQDPADQEMPQSSSTTDEPQQNDDDASPLAAKSQEETEAPMANGEGQADETELTADTSAAEDGFNNGHISPLEEAKAALARYHIYNAHYDETIYASTMLSTAEQQKLRTELEAQLKPFQRLVHKLAQQLQQQLQTWQPYGWQRGLDDGLLDLQRLSRIYTHRHSAQLIFKQPHMALARDCVITLLLDNSGSMRGRPILITALCADILAHTLERCGVKVEILGYTTKQWKGGQPYKEWQEKGKAPNPGRLNELRHIIYKSADQNWRQSRLSIAAMLKEGLLKENIDGEALLWSYSRLVKRREKRKILMVISDGAPVDDATLSANNPDYLEQHLHDTIAWINLQNKVELVAIGIGHDVDRYYPRATMITDVESLAETMLGELGKLLRG
jgi:cobaltochelatase CobT